MPAWEGTDHSKLFFLIGRGEGKVEGGTAVLSQAETGRLSSQYLSLLSKQGLLS